MKIFEKTADLKKRLAEEVSSNIIGQQDVIEKLLISLLCSGHCLLEGVPGLAKTLLVKSVAGALDLEFSRIQFTPDLMPSDITGSEILEENEKQRKFVFHKGPVFSNLVLADEINRTPPKTQAALLEAMQERHVTISGNSYPVLEPFMVLATQNPIEQEGTYPLPEAQLDRFLFHLKIGYPSVSEEEMIVRRMTEEGEKKLKKVVAKDEIAELRQLVYQVPVSDEIISFAVRAGRMTRPQESTLKETQKWLEYGVSPRAIQWLVLSAKTRSLLQGKPSPGISDVKELIPDVFRHRIVLNFQAESEGISADNYLSTLISSL